MKRIYFDNAATTPIRKKVLKAIKPYLTKYYGNPSSLHKEGRIASKAIEDARTKIAKILNVQANEIFFISGASEGNSWVGKNFWLADVGNSHSSITMIPQQTKNRPFMATAPYVESETGLCNMEGVLRLVKSLDENVHLDLTQTIPHFIPDLKELNISCATFSGHKIGALKGCGVMYIREDMQQYFQPLIYGHQENELRGGTENVVGIVALSVALEETVKNYDKENKRKKRIGFYIYRKLKDVVKDISLSNDIINITFNNLNAQSAVQILDKQGIAVSAGSACVSDSDEPAEAYLARMSREDALKTIRVSIGFKNTLHEAKKFCKILRIMVALDD